MSWSELHPLLSEMAGALALEELILGRRLQLALDEAAVVITEADINDEQRLLLDSLHADPDTAIRLLDELRTRRGLGPARYHAMLARNASLRGLVSGDVRVSEPAIARLYEMRYGPRRQARIITVPTLEAALDVIERVEDGGLFAEVAVEVSTDASAARGGLLEPLSRADPSYPEVLRETLWSLATSEMSTPILSSEQYVVLQLVREILPDDRPPLEDVRVDLAREVRLQQERVLMDGLARRLVMTVTVTVFDESLNDSWQRRRRQARSGGPR